MKDRGIRFNQEGNDNDSFVRLSEGKNASKDDDLRLSFADFNARAAIIDNKLTITEAEVDAFLEDDEKRK
jgi:hypothetical protein